MIDGGQDGEVFTVSMCSSRHPDVRLNIMVNSTIVEDDGGLLKRVDGKASLLASLGVTSHTLRRGKVSLSQRPAEKLIDSAKDNGKAIRQFDIETTLATPSSIAAPQIHVNMAMGGQVPDGEYVDASLPEGDRLALWDAIVKSVRVRPGGN